MINFRKITIYITFLNKSGEKAIKACAFEQHCNSIKLFLNQSCDV